MSRIAPLLLSLVLIGCGGRDEKLPPKDDPLPPLDTSLPDVPEETDDDFENATDITEILDFSVPVAEDAIDPPGDRDFFVIQATAGQIFSFYTDAYHSNGNGSVDTVLRVYDQDEELLVENDDMPYRFWETDSAVFWQAEYDGPYYIEVLEWADWAGEDPEGGSDAIYALYGRPYIGSEVEPNDSQADADANSAAEESVYFTDVFSEYAVFFGGEMKLSGEVDVYPFSFTIDSDGSTYHWSLWPDSYGATRPRFTLYDSQWNLLAQTDDAAVTSDFAFLYDAGLMRRIIGGETYYLAVEDRSGASGPGSFYFGIIQGWTDALADEEAEPNDPTQPNAITMTEWSSTAGNYYGRVTGYLPSTDTSDTVSISAADVGGSLTGRYLSVQLEAKGAGSQLDSLVRVLKADGTELASASDHPDLANGDPQVRNLVLSTNDTVRIVIEPESRGADLSNAWFLRVDVTADALTF